MNMPLQLFFCAAAYLLGSLPTAWLVMKAKTGQDLHRFGSGNIGATNLTKQLGKAWGAPVFLFDAAKGALALMLARGLGTPLATQLLCALCAVLGHDFPVWLNFKGGKGVSTTLGVIAVLNPPVCLLCLCLWYGLFKLKGYVSLASMVSLAAAPAGLLIARQKEEGILCLLLALLSLWQHRSNISRLRSGHEHNFKGKKKSAV